MASSINTNFYLFYFCSLDGVSDKLQRHMYKDNHTVFAKEYKEKENTYELGLLDINSKQGEFIDWYEVPKNSVHHFEIK